MLLEVTIIGIILAKNYECMFRFLKVIEGSIAERFFERRCIA